jgi:type IV secretory pathway TrbD component
MKNNTDIILKDTSLLGDTSRKIELDDTPDRAAQFKLDVTRYLMLPANPIQLILDGLAWTNASAILLFCATLWSPVILVWGIWSLALCILVWLPSSVLGHTVRICACIRLLQVCIGALALTITL